MLYEVRPGIEGDGNCYVQNFSAPREIDAVYVSLVTENYEVWSKKVDIQDGKCTAVFGEAATRGEDFSWTSKPTGNHPGDWTFYTTNEDGERVDQYILQFHYQNYEYFSLLASAEYLIAWEDLGGDFDFDFNDLVMKVRRDFSDMNKFLVEVQVLAAGGTMPIAIGCKGMKGAPTSASQRWLLTFNDKQDIHAAWGVDENVRVNTVLRESEPNYDNLKDLFEPGQGLDPLKTTIELDVTDTYTTTLASVMNKFFLVRQQKYNRTNSNSTTWDLTSLHYNLGTEKIEGVNGPSYQQGIVIVNSNWVWPEEHHCILDAYPAIKDWTDGKNSEQSGSKKNDINIWSGTDENTYHPNPAPFESMLNAKWNELHPGYGDFNTDQTFWQIRDVVNYEWEDACVVKMDFQEILDFTEDSDYFMDFIAIQREAASSWDYPYDVPFMSHRVLIPWSKVQNYIYRYTGQGLVYRNSDGLPIYCPGDEMFAIAIVMINRPYNEETALFLSTGAYGDEVYEGDLLTSNQDGRSPCGWFKSFEDKEKRAVDIYFGEVFLQNTSIDSDQWEKAFGDSWNQIHADYTKFAWYVGEDKVFPYDLMISPYTKVGSYNYITPEGQQKTTEKYPEAKIYKVFVGRPIRPELDPVNQGTTE